MSKQPPKKKTKLDKEGEEKELKLLEELEAVQGKLEKINNEVSEKAIAPLVFLLIQSIDISY